MYGFRKHFYSCIFKNKCCSVLETFMTLRIVGDFFTKFTLVLLGMK